MRRIGRPSRAGNSRCRASTERITHARRPPMHIDHVEPGRGACCAPCSRPAPSRCATITRRRGRGQGRRVAGDRRRPGGRGDSARRPRGRCAGHPGDRRGGRRRQAACPTSARAFFLVDPLDGTREFINKRGEFTVNVALDRRRRAGASASSMRRRSASSM